MPDRETEDIQGDSKETSKGLTAQNQVSCQFKNERQSNDCNVQGQIKRLGLPDSFIQHGKRDELLDEIGLDENSIINTIKSLFVNTSNDILIES